MPASPVTTQTAFRAGPSTTATFREEMMTTTFTRRAAMALAAAAGIAIATVAGAQAQSAPRTEKLVLRLGALGSGTEHDIQSYPIKALIAEVEEKTGGMIAFEYFPGGQLGGEPEMMDQVLSGSLDVGVLSANVLATVWPQLYAYNLPFAFSDIDEFWKIAGGEAPFASALREAVNAGGDARLVSTFSAEFRGLQNTKRAIRTTDDLKGLTLRVMAGEIFSDTFRSMGATTAAVPFAELYTGLQQGVIDGEDIGMTMFYDVKLYEVEKHLTQLNMTPTVNVLLMSARAWDKLSEEERQIIQTAAFNAEKASKAAVSERSAKYPAMIESVGVNVVLNKDLTEAEKATFTDATKSVWEKYRTIIGDDVYNAYEASRGQ